MAEPAELPEDPMEEIEQRVKDLEAEIEPLRRQAQVHALVISQYQQALAKANHQNAILTAQLKLAQQPTA